MFEGLFGDPSQQQQQPVKPSSTPKKFGGPTSPTVPASSSSVGQAGAALGLGALLQAQQASHVQQQPQQPQQSFVPQSFVPQEAPVETSAPPPSAPPPTPVPSIPPPVVPAVPRCQAMHSYEARSANELGFQPGDIITIVTKDPGGWWEGELNGQRGWLPSNFVQEI